MIDIYHTETSLLYIITKKSYTAYDNVRYPSVIFKPTAPLQNGLYCRLTNYELLR